jgi:nucleotide-binding universal stress UspA family protein
MKILLAVDPSGTTGFDKVADQAIALAKERGAELTAFSVAPLLQYSDEPFPSDALTDKLLETAKEAAERVRAKAAQAGLRATAVVEQGISPADNVIDHAEAQQVDLIVTGSRRKTGLDRFLIGSVAARIVSHAPCSVLVVR